MGDHSEWFGSLHKRDVTKKNNDTVPYMLMVAFSALVSTYVGLGTLKEECKWCSVKVCGIDYRIVSRL